MFARAVAVFTSGSGVRAQEAAGSYIANEALGAMAEGLGSELGPRVRVNVVAPAFMDTGLWRNKPREDIDARIKFYSSVNPMGRLGTVEEVAAAYLFAMTNSYVTGQTLRVDGGMMLRKYKCPAARFPGRAGLSGADSRTPACIAWVQRSATVSRCKSPLDW